MCIRDRLLGGKCRDKIRVYGHVFARNDDELVENCKKKREQGYTAVGHLSPFLDEPISVPYDKTHAKNMDEAIKRVHLMREAVGDNVDPVTYTHLPEPNPWIIIVRRTRALVVVICLPTLMEYRRCNA